MMLLRHPLGLIGYVIFFAFVAGLAFAGTALNLVVIGSVTLFLAMQVFRSSPNALLTFWLVSVAIFPPWVAFYAGGYRLPAAALVSIAVLFAVRKTNSVRFNWIDGSVIGLIVSASVGSAFFGTPLHIATQALLEWGCCYGAGRFLFEKANLPQICNKLGGVLGIFACFQFVTKINLATVFPFSINAESNQWTVLQERGGTIRSELTFGHSISLGAVLVILLAFGLTARGKYAWTFSLISLVGIITTFSRSAIAAAVITVVLTILRSRATSAGKTLAIVACGGIAYVISVQFLAAVSGSTNAVELSDSTDYREGLLSLFSIVKLLGLAPSGVPSSLGVTYTWGDFYSIDNGLLFVGLYAGAVAMVLYAVVPIVVLVQNRWRSWNQFSTFTIAQIPFIVTVAPITQYQNYYWMFLGMAVTCIGLRKSSSSSSNHFNPTQTQRDPEKLQTTTSTARI